MEQKLKQTIGDLYFTVLYLQTQLDVANARITELEKKDL